MTHPAPDRAARWVRRDVRRLLARAEQSNGQAITRDELRYLRGQAVLLLAGPLPVDPDDAVKLQGLVLAVDRTLREDGDAAR